MILSSKSSFLFLIFFLLLLLPLPPFSQAQLTQSETRILIQIQKFLEHPSSLQSWTNWANFCFLPPSPSFKIVCSNNRITELTVTGNKTASPNSKLSKNFSIDSFFTVLTKLSNLKSLSLVSLGIWGPLPPKIARLSSLQILNLSSNFISGEIPKEINSLSNLQSLVLSDNLFKGNVSDLRGLKNLQELNLSGNKFGPEIASIGTNLVTVLLQNNSFRSTIPQELKKLNKLQRLDLSSNNLLGPIPEFLFFLSSIQNINFAQNRLSGSIPNSVCRSKLKSLDISHNLLVGKIPFCLLQTHSPNLTFFYSFNCLSIVNSKYQRPVSFCQKQAVAVKPVLKEDKKKKKDSSVQLGVVVGIIGGVLAVTAALSLLTLVLMRRSEKEKPETNRFVARHVVADKMSVCSSSSKPVPDPKRVPQTMRSAVIGLLPYRVFTLEDIEEATDSFDSTNLIDEQLYKGCLREGTRVIVKCIKLKQKNSSQCLAQQMEVLSKLRHMHLVSVLGHCIVSNQDHPYAGSTIFVVQEYISNGSLKEYLSDWRKKEMLKWPQRMSITIGIARGIQFLHTGVAPGVFGNHLKIDNILLDETLTAKISGYNIPLPSKVDAENQTQDVCSNRIAEREDVHQFGVILLEVITGRVVTSLSELEDLRTQMENGLVEGATKLRSLIDPAVRGTYAFESLRTTAEFTIKCLSADPDRRPSIEDVVWNLQYTIQVQDGWNSSGNLATQM